MERQSAEATEAAQLATATAASLREAAALEARIAALHAEHAPAPTGGDPNSRVAVSLVRLGLPRARLPEAAREVTALSPVEGVALTPETEISRLVRYKKAAAAEGDSDSGVEVSASFFASQI